MDKVLPTLIDGAKTVRDRHGVAARQAAAAVAQAQATLDRLQQFRAECLTRAPGTQGASDGQALADYQVFLGRLDAAITQQGHEHARRGEWAASAQQALVASQQRLMAFETLVTRRAAVRNAKEDRKARRDTDEFAARAARRQAQEMTE